MKKKLRNIGLWAMAFGLLACDMELNPYAEEINRISFVYEEAADTLVRYTFAYQQSEVVQDTVWVRATVVGQLSEQPREVKIEQLFLNGKDNAEVGVHFESLQDSYVIEAHETGVDVPIVLKRDTSLLKREYTLGLVLKETDDFELVTPKSTVKQIVFSDILLKPSTWEDAADFYFSGYGYVKHKFMIDVVAEYDMVLDDAWIEKVVADYPYVTYWISVFNAALAEENAARAARGEGPLCEGPEYGDVEVYF